MDPVESPVLAVARPAGYPFVEVELALVDPPDEQLRADLDPDKLEELARSIGREGLLQPPGLRPVDGRFVVVWGHRRTEACRLLGWRRMPACVVEGDPDQLLVKSAAENLERSDLTPVEEAAAVDRLYQSMGQDVDAVARRINRSRGWVESRLRLLAWPGDVSAAVHQGRLSLAAGAELAAITEDVHRRFLLGHAIEGGATARTCQAWRIAWLQGLPVGDPSVVQVGPSGVQHAPVEAMLPCYCCGLSRKYSELQHVWLDAACFELSVAAWAAARESG